MTKLTDEAKKYIQQYHYNSQRVLAEQLYVLYGIKITHAAVGRYKKQYLQTLEKPIPDATQTITNAKSWEFSREKLTFSEFMTKLKKSHSYSANLLRQKLKVKGRHKQINQDRILRIIQYTIDILQE